MTALLTRISEQLNICTDPLQRAELWAERACYLARIGDFAGANEIAISLRRLYGDGQNARISVWIMLVEGLVLYFEEVSAVAYDRILRATALSAAMKMPRLQSLTSSWLAHLEFARGDYESMADLISAALDINENQFHDVQLRIGMVLGDSYLYLGERAKSQIWYEKTHWHAIQAGDQAAIGAIMYNRAVFGLAFECNDIQLGKLPVDFVSLRSIELELESAQSFQMGTGVRSLSHLIDLAKAQILMLREEWFLAADVLKRLCMRSDQKEFKRHKPLLLTNLTWCLLRLGLREEALKLLDTIQVDRHVGLDADDQLSMLATLLRINISLARLDEIEILQKLLSNVTLNYTNEKERLRVALASIAFADRSI